MARRIWQFGLGILLCAVFYLGLVLFSPVGAQENEILLYLPVVYGDSPLTEPVDQGSLGIEELVIKSLAEGVMHRWTMYILEAGAITVTAAPGTSADIVLSLYDSEGLVLEQNSSGPGEVETIMDLGIAETGEYELLVQTADGQATDYALMLLDQESYHFVFRGTLDDNDSRNDSLPVETDHFWFFNGQAGETVSFTISPDSSSDAYVELFGPSGVLLETIDDYATAQPESLLNYPILATGLYGIRVGEFDYAAMDYQIIISRP